jgi:GNAT superfamily N-acetyltransferase
MIEVRLANPDEAEIVRQITLDAFESSRELLNPPAGALFETIEELNALIATQGVVLALLDGEPVGACRMTIYEDHIYCGRLGVFPDAQGKGVGTAILNFLEEEARKRNLPEVRLATREVLAENVAYYQKLGYVTTRRTKHPRGPDMVIEFAKRVDTQQ